MTKQLEEIEKVLPVLSDEELQDLIYAAEGEQAQRYKALHGKPDPNTRRGFVIEKFMSSGKGKIIVGGAGGSGESGGSTE